MSKITESKSPIGFVELYNPDSNLVERNNAHVDREVNPENR